MTLITIQVTQDDIDHGVAADCQHCPVARAVIRACQDDRSLYVYHTVFRIREEDDEDIDICSLPQEAVDWVDHFDGKLHRSLPPITFTITIPDTDPAAVKARLAELELTARGD